MVPQLLIMCEKLPLYGWVPIAVVLIEGKPEEDGRRAMDHFVERHMKGENLLF